MAHGLWRPFPIFGPEVVAVKQRPSETMELTFKSGAVVIWGALETETCSSTRRRCSRAFSTMRIKI